MSEPNPPPFDYNGLGWANTGKIRIRTGWFGFAVVEELYAHKNGGAQWRRLFLPTIIKEGRASRGDPPPSDNEGGYDGSRRIQGGYQGQALREPPANPPSGGSSVAPLTGGYFHKGRINYGPSQVTERPPPPPAMKPKRPEDFASDNGFC